MAARKRLPVEIRNYSGDSFRVFFILKKYYERKRVMAGVEIGVHRGFLSSLFLRAFPNLTLFMVDSWTAMPPDTRCLQARQIIPQHHHERLMATAIEVTEFAKDRRVIMRMLSTDAARTFRPAQLDWAFVDACHEYDAVVDDMNRYWPTIKPGGIFSGHDYNQAAFPGVIKAVDEFAARHKLTVGLQGHCWWMVKPL